MKVDKTYFFFLPYLSVSSFNHIKGTIGFGIGTLLKIFLSAYYYYRPDSLPGAGIIVVTKQNKTNHPTKQTKNKFIRNKALLFTGHTLHMGESFTLFLKQHKKATV